ncbi:MAG TPA: hypothetical protein VNV17_10180, partial [Solirubrobacteraceae bacterium]|nr:hypothetical protein [Solirubrobacteraceae bacterium]
GEAVIAGTERRRVATATSVDLIITGPPDEHIITVTTAQDIITRTPIEYVGPGSAGQRVVAGAALEGDDVVGERALALVDANLIIARAALDVDGAERAPIEAEVDRPVVTHVHVQRVGLPWLQT